MKEKRVSSLYSTLSYFIAISIGIIFAFYLPSLKPVAYFISELFIRILKLVSLPMIFFSIISVIGNMEETSFMRKLGKKVFLYTLSTTFIASLIGLLSFLWIQPAKHFVSNNSIIKNTSAIFSSSKLMDIAAAIPDNAIRVFLQGNIVGVLSFALFIGLAVFSIPKKEKEFLSLFCSSLFSALLKIPMFLLSCMPIIISSFVFLLTQDIKEALQGKTIENDLSIKALLFYILTIIFAQSFHACVFLPLFLKIKNISPLHLFRQMFPALSLAFFSKSSNIALPIVMKKARENLNISKEVTEFTFPLCSTINMNGCAIFVLVTILFVSNFQGISYTWVDLLGWVLISTLGAISNAGIPMGGYAIVVALLTMLQLPFSLSGIILTLNALFFDMIETSVNVWSDICIASIVNKECQKQK